MKKLTCITLAAACSLMLAACGAQNQETAANSDNTSAPEALTELNVVLDWYPNAVHAFIYDAIEKGYYEDEGLKVNIQFPSNANDALSLVAAGRAEIGVYYMQDIITTRTNQNVPVKSFSER